MAIRTQILGGFEGIKVPFSINMPISETRVFDIISVEYYCLTWLHNQQVPILIFWAQLNHVTNSTIISSRKWDAVEFVKTVKNKYKLTPTIVIAEPMLTNRHGHSPLCTSGVCSFIVPSLLSISLYKTSDEGRCFHIISNPRTACIISAQSGSNLSSENRKQK